MPATAPCPPAHLYRRGLLVTMSGCALAAALAAPAEGETGVSPQIPAQGPGPAGGPAGPLATPASGGDTRMPGRIEQSSTDAQATTGVSDIVVTAQRRAENLQNVPVSVTAFSAANLATRDITDVSRLENLVPGFTFARSGSDARPSLRGVRTDNVAINGEPVIGFFVDGVYQSRTGQALVGFVDIAQVEVQRGPQGTLYGRNTFGGNISVSTQAPKIGVTEAGADLTVGSFNRVRAEAFLNIPLSTSLAARIAGSYEYTDGFVKNDNPAGRNLFGVDSGYIRGSLKLEPNDRFRAVLRADYNKQGGPGASASGYKQAGTYVYAPTCQQLFNATPLRINARPGNRDGIADCTTAAGVGVDLGVPIYKQNDPYRIDTDFRTFLHQVQWSTSLDASYDLSFATVKSITSYTYFNGIRTADSDFSANTIAIDLLPSTSKAYSEELQLLSRSKAPFNWVVGAYFFHDSLGGGSINQQVPRVIYTPTGVLNLSQAAAGTYDQQQGTTRSAAVYAQGAYNITDRFALTLGGRYTNDRKTFQFANANLILPLITSATGVQTPNTNLVNINQLRTIPAASFGQRGTTNCTFAGALPGFYCAPYNPTILVGATYDPRTFEQFTYRVGLDYKISPANLLYLTYSTGFESGGFNSGQAAAGLAPTFAPETVKALELGSKNRFLDNTQVNLSAYYNWYDNLQEQRAVPVGGTTVSGVFNAAKGRSYGLEAEVQWRPTPPLSISAVFAAQNAKYTSFADVPLTFGTSITVAGQTIFAPGYNCRVIPGTSTAGCDLSGFKIPNSPDYSGSVTVSYDVDLGSAMKLTPLATVTYSSSFFGTIYNDPLATQPSYAKLDLSLNLAFDQRYSLHAFVDNLTDKATANRFVYGAGALQESFEPPRTFGVRASARF